VGWKGQARPSACRGHMGRGIDGSLHYLSLTTTGKVGPALHSALWSWGLSLGACYSGLTWDFVPCRFSFPSGIPTAAAAQPACPCGEEVGGGRPPPPAGTPLPTFAAWEPLPCGANVPLCSWLTRLESCLSCDGVVLLGCFSFSVFLGRQEPPQPLNLTAKPKVPELPNTSSSPSLKMNSCGPRPASHGAPTRDLQSSPPSLPLGKPFHLLSP
jgi:hypothetical protein